MIENDGIAMNKINSIVSSNTVNQYKVLENQQAKEKNTKGTNSKKQSKDIYSTIRKKATVIDGDQRYIQEKISLIQAKEQEIDNIENVLKNTKREYQHALETTQKEEVKQRIKIRQLSREMVDLKNKSSRDLEEDEPKYRQSELQDEEKIISKINDILKRVNSIKSKLAQYKSELMAISEDVESNKKRISAKENELMVHLEDADYVIDGVSINTSNCVDLRGNVITGLIIDIYI